MWWMTWRAVCSRPYLASAEDAARYAHERTRDSFNGAGGGGGGGAGRGGPARGPAPAPAAAAALRRRAACFMLATSQRVA
jgi:hypothetical protein